MHLRQYLISFPAALLAYLMLNCITYMSYDMIRFIFGITRLSIYCADTLQLHIQLSTGHNGRDT